MSLSTILSIGVSGVAAFARSLAAVSANIANSQTDGYKRVRTDFAELLPAGDVGGGPVATRAAGAGTAASARLFAAEQGAVRRTDEPTNLAILGDGFFVVAEEADGAGGIVFTRAGGFAPDALGRLVNASGQFLQGAPTGANGEASVGAGLSSLSTIDLGRLPPGRDAASLGALTGVSVDADGRVIGSYENGETHALYVVPLALFANADGLERAADTSFRTTLASGAAALRAPGEGRAGAIESAAVELSTVDIGAEFSTLIATQRAYATNARVLSTADDLMRRIVETAA